ncbi:hypothetical protein [uncultured Algoriphagus sp.]|uniref:hypothetical protein n=1 Tax=uncultured Algoriphagus sp. TaxID=417365 RepID=UPI002596611D|nr:hypothetical protein [uncultured Algoriphagus sp.]
MGNLIKIGLFISLFFICQLKSKANDSLSIAQSYINLSLTIEYFDSLSQERISKILPFVESDLSRIKDQSLDTKNGFIFHLSQAQLNFLKIKTSFSSSLKAYSITRPDLLAWKTQLDETIQLVDTWEKSQIISSDNSNQYFEIIGVTDENFEKFTQALFDFRDELNTQINLNIYPDIRRIYFQAKNQDKYFFDSLDYYVSLFDMDIDFSILGSPSIYQLSKGYTISHAIALISNFLQLKYISKKNKYVGSTYELHKAMNDLEIELNLADSSRFLDYSNNYRNDIPKDDFFRSEFTQETINYLREELLKKFTVDPDDRPELLLGHSMEERNLETMIPTKFYFPKIAPFPSAKIAIPNFLEDSVRLEQVDNFIKKSFEDAGYKERLHYFYLHEPGFAVTTGIERIQKDGSPKTPETSRWDLSGGFEGSLSLYRIFKAIFFATESDFRIIACIVSPNEAITSIEATSFSTFTSLMENYYSSLPPDLREVELPNKTLTILVYHFLQSDIGEVPVLDISKRLTVSQHLEKTRSLKSLTAD